MTQHASTDIDRCRDLVATAAQHYLGAQLIARQMQRDGASQQALDAAELCVMRADANLTAATSRYLGAL